MLETTVYPDDIHAALLGTVLYMTIPLRSAAFYIVRLLCFYVS